MKNAVQLVLFGDTHELHREVDIPAGDILVFSGDLTMRSRSLASIEDFNEFLGAQPHPYKLVVPGNHDSFLETHYRRRKLLSNATILIDEAIEFLGLRIFGSPVIPTFEEPFSIARCGDAHALPR